MRLPRAGALPPDDSSVLPHRRCRRLHPRYDNPSLVFSLTELISLFLFALAGSLALTPVCRYVAKRAGYVAAPTADRWHKKPTALLGGVAISVATLGTAIATGRFADHWEIILCGAFISAFGLADDLLSLKASTKLIAQVMVASLLVFFGYRLEWTTSLVGDTMLTLFWIVGITNAFNLLDNMDGLCAGTTLIGGTFLLIGFAQDPGAAAAAQYGAVLLGATAGFFVYNVYPASIFMGDAGSLFLGFNLAALTLLARPHGSVKSGLLSIVAAPVLLLLIPIFDTTLVTALRLLSGRRPSQGGRDHASHRLVAVGLSERAAVMVLWTLAAGGGAVSVLLQRGDPSWGIITALGLLLAMVIFGVYLARIRVYESQVSPFPESVTPLVTDFMYKRRVAEVLLDLCLIPLAYYTAYRLRFEGELLLPNYPFFLRSLPVVLSSQLLALFVVGGYRGTWRYFGMMDAVVFVKGVILGTVSAELVILELVPLRELFAVGVRHRRGDPGAVARRDQGLVSPRRRVRRSAPIGGPAMPHLWNRRREPRDHSGSVRSGYAVEDCRIHRRQSVPSLEHGRRLSGSR